LCGWQSAIARTADEGCFWQEETDREFEQELVEMTMTKITLHPAFQRMRDLIDEAFLLHGSDADARREHVLARITRGQYDEFIAAIEAAHQRSARIDRPPPSAR
jgi:hypothetical protein